MNMNNLMKQAQQMQAKLAMLQNELAEREVEASAGGGMVKVKVNGKQQLLSVSINKECVDPNDVATLEELVFTAVNQAMSQDMVQQAMSKVTGGMNIPGLF
jgi:DNA-binding YbaB/EbfC family protein